MRRVVFRQQARRELDEAGDWYEKERIGLGLEFFTEIEHLLHRVTGNPAQFPVSYRGTRKAVARRFPYCVYFRERDQIIVVVAVFHCARNPSAWKSRVK